MHSSQHECLKQLVPSSFKTEVALVPWKSIFFKTNFIDGDLREIVLRMAGRLAVFPVSCSLAAVSVGAM